MTLREFVVVGGGISGLVATWELTGGAVGRAEKRRVTLIEASPRLGGPLRSEMFGGRLVDMGPDGFLGRRPEAVELCHELGLVAALEPIAAHGASVWARNRLRPLPEGHALGIPTRFWPTVRTGALGPAGMLGLARDALLPRPDVRGPMGDRSVGPLVTRKLGRQVVDTLVDPLFGGIYAGTVDDMSAAATYPPLLAAAQRRGSLMRRLRARGARPGRRVGSSVVLVPSPGDGLARRHPGACAVRTQCGRSALNPSRRARARRWAMVRALRQHHDRG